MEVGGDLKLISLLCLLALLLATVAFNSGTSSRRRRLLLPPSPTAIPVIGHLHLLSRIPHQSLHKLSTTYGPLFSLRFGSVPCIVASSATAAKEFLKTHELSFSDRPESKAAAYLEYNSAGFSFAPYGPYWRFMKKLCMSEFLGGRALDKLNFIRSEETLNLIESLQAKAKEKESVDVRGELLKFANNVICRMAMSRRCSGTEGEAAMPRKLVEETAELTGKFNLSDYIWFLKNYDLQGFDKKLEDLRSRFDEMMEGILEEKEAKRRAGGDGNPVKDILDMLLDIAEDGSSEIRLSRANIKAFIMVNIVLLSTVL